MGGRRCLRTLARIIVFRPVAAAASTDLDVRRVVFQSLVELTRRASAMIHASPLVSSACCRRLRRRRPEHTPRRRSCPSARPVRFVPRPARLRPTAVQRRAVWPPSPIAGMPDYRTLEADLARYGLLWRGGTSGTLSGLGADPLCRLARPLTS